MIFLLLWGGIHPTIRAEESLDHADMVCIGEGEETIVELQTKYKINNIITISKVWGLITKEK